LAEIQHVGDLGRSLAERDIASTKSTERAGFLVGTKDPIDLVQEFAGAPEGELGTVDVATIE
jgi:hypothetical protein